MAFSKMGLKSVRQSHKFQSLQLRFDIDQDEKISFSEFIDVFHEANLRKTFDTLDIFKNGEISMQEFRIALRKHLGWRVTDELATQLVQMIDADQDGVIKYDEFRDAFSKCELPDLRSIVQRWINLTNMDAGSELFPGLPPDAGSSVALWRYFLAGGIAGSVSRFALAPAERIIISMQTSDTTSSIRQVYRNVIREEGWTGLFRGTGMSLIKVFPFSGIVCISYSNLLKVMDRTDFESISGMGLQTKRLIAGALAAYIETAQNTQIAYFPQIHFEG